MNMRANWTSRITYGLRAISGSLRRLALVLFALFAIANALPAQAAVPDTERQTLIDLYNSSGGPNWNYKDGWLGGAGTECNWVGIVCNADRTHVVYIDLTSNNLTGTLPSITGLTQLQVFVVSQNKLTGSIPSLAGLTNLRVFYVERNQLTGSIPALQGLTGLEIFSARLNQLTGPVPALAGLANLEYFDVSRNELSGRIPAVEGLENLYYFRVSDNQLSGSIPSLAGLSGLQYIDVSGNQLTGQIPPLMGLTSLVYIAFADNQLSGPIPSLEGLASLKYVWGYNNQLSGSIPSLSSLTSLEYLVVRENQLSGSIPALASLSHLTIVEVADNQLSGSIPSLAGLDNLEIFNVYSNQLTGEVPSVEGLANLQVFAAMDNRLGGALPPLAGLTELQWFDVSDNSLTGPIPPLDGLEKLQGIRVGGNRLTGSVPSVPDALGLNDGDSSLCPNYLDPTEDARWDAATGETPWYQNCSSVPHSPVVLNQHGLTGSWSNPATDGQGLLMEVYPDLYSPGLGLLFGGWFTYDGSAAGGQRWYSIQGEVRSDNMAASMPIYESRGGRFDSPQATTLTEVGQATIGFSDCTHGTLDYAFHDGSGRSGSIPLTRLIDNVTCAEDGDSGATSGNYLWSGTWADPGNSGQGILFDVNPVRNVLFAAWFTYSADADPDGGAAAHRWYTLQATMPPAAHGTDEVGIYETTGGVFDDATAPSTVKVGHAAVSFNSCTSVTLTYTFTAGGNQGRTGTIALERVGPAPAGCQL